MSLQTNDAPALVPTIVSEAQEVPIPEPSDGICDLPGGFLDVDGTVHKSVQIRELTGADEEALARATRKGGTFDPFLYIRTVVKRCLEAVGSLQVTDQILDRMLIGDRDWIALHIRIASYGNEYEIKLTCPRCAHEWDAAVELNRDITCKNLPDPEVWFRDIELPKGRKAIAHLVTVADQTVALADDARTGAEIDTVLLARVVKEIDGQPVIGEQTFRDAKAADRKAITKYLADTQPGPNFREVKGECPACNEELNVPLSLPALFL
jgi:hypothetical protein